MKIAFFTDTYYPQINGVSKSIEIFVNQLRKNGHEVHLFCPDGLQRKKYIHPLDSSTFTNYPEYRLGLPDLKIINEVKKIDPDVIHVHSPFSIGVTGMSVAKILKIPVVATYHTHLSAYFDYMGSMNFSEDMAYVYTKWFYDRASINIVPSKSIRNFLRKCEIKKPIKLVPTPLDFRILKRSNRKGKKLKILHVGRLCKEKRIEMVLNAFESVHKKIDSKLIISSDGPDRERLEEICKELKIEKDVVFTGYISNKKLLKLYSSSDVFVSASDTETQGLVILEAMSRGCPVIARNALGFKDVIHNKKNGILFDTEDELVKNILLLNNNNKLRKSLVNNGYETVKMFNISNYVNRMENIYRESSDKKKDSKKIWKILYFSYLFFISIESILIKSMDITVNSRFLDLHMRFFKSALFFEKLRRP